MGARLARYRLVALLGSGGMGDVHRAFDTLLRRDVAIGEDDDGDAFIVMELVEGRTLRELMRGPLDVDRATKLRWLADIASALEAAHRASLVHRDIKPDNLIITPAGQVKVLDFGIAKFRTRDPASGPMPSAPPSSRIAGTPAYMAPEQWAGVVDERVDQ